MDDNFVIPDRWRPVLGIRQFVITPFNNKFFSPNRGGAEWVPGEWMKAECIPAKKGANYDVFSDKHKSPSDLCNCGIYAGYDFPSLWMESTPRINQYSIAEHPLDGRTPAQVVEQGPNGRMAYAGGYARKCAYALVAMRGDIIYARHVMLASEATIVAMIDPPHFASSNFETPIYTPPSVDVHTVSAASRVKPHNGLASDRQLQDIAEAHGFEIHNMEKNGTAAQMQELADLYNCDYVSLNEVLLEMWANEEKEEA